MADIKKVVTTSKDEGLTSTGGSVQQETQQVNTEVTGNNKTTAANGIWYLVGFVEIMLAFRFILKLFGANPDSGFVNFIYALTGVLTLPFDSIFGVTKPETGAVVTSVFEPSILVAAVVYALIGWGVIKLININHPAEQ